MGRKGNLAVFESTNISETKIAMPTKIGVHACDINPSLHKFFGLIPNWNQPKKLCNYGLMSHACTPILVDVAS